MTGKDTSGFWPKEGEGKLTKPTKKAPAKKKATAKKKASPEVISALNFDTHGWCEELGKTYLMGKYVPKTKKEYDALKPYSIEGKK